MTPSSLSSAATHHSRIEQKTTPQPDMSRQKYYLSRQVFAAVGTDGKGPKSCTRSKVNPIQPVQPKLHFGKFGEVSPIKPGNIAR